MNMVMLIYQIIKELIISLLVDKINNLNYKLYWILPVAKNIKRLYDLDININNQNDIRFTD